MVLDPWAVLGDAEMTEYWRSVVPALSTDAAGDQTGVENDRHRVASVRQRYALELKHLTQTERSRGFVTSRLTRISDWSPLTDQERIGTRAESGSRSLGESPRGYAREVVARTSVLTSRSLCPCHRRFCPPDC